MKSKTEEYSKSIGEFPPSSKLKPPKPKSLLVRQVMDEFTKFNNQTAGRDKIFRLVQYTSRIVWYNLERRGSSQGRVEKVKRLDEILGLMRRLLRFGRFFETLHSALPVFATVANPLIRFTSAMSRVSNGCYMFIDHVVCLDKLGLLPAKLIDAAKWDKMSTKFWLYAIILGLVRDVYEIMKIYKEEYRTRRNTLFNQQQQQPKTLAASAPVTSSLNTFEGSFITNETNAMEVEVQRSTQAANQRQQSLVRCLARLRVTSQCVMDHADVAVDTTKNLLDLFIPLNSLGFTKFSPGLISFLGVLGTLLSALPQINPMIKMVPAT